MSYKDINEKYRKILQEDAKKRAEEKEEVMNEAMDANKKKAFNEFKKAKKDVDKLMDKIQKGIDTISADFMMGQFKGWGGVADMQRVKNDLKNIAEYIVTGY
jgi:hypothetical protein